MTARIRRNTAAALAKYQIAGLAFLEDTILFTARTLSTTYPTIYRSPAPDDHAELASARELLAACGHVVDALKAHWNQAAVHLPASHPAKSKIDDDDLF